MKKVTGNRKGKYYKGFYTTSTIPNHKPKRARARARYKSNTANKTWRDYFYAIVTYFLIFCLLLTLIYFY